MRWYKSSIKTSPIPKPEASTSNINSLEKLGRAKTGVEERNYFKCWKANVIAVDQTKLSFLSISVNGLATLPNLGTNL